jgi:hypothetical protein
MIETTTSARIGFVGGVVRGPPPVSCASTCKDRYTDICTACTNRPIKSVDITYAGGSVDDAVRAGLTTMAAVRQFREQITGGT